MKSSDIIMAADKIAKRAGLYREADHDNPPVQVTQVTVILDRGGGKTETETREIVEGAGRVLDPSEEEPS